MAKLNAAPEIQSALMMPRSGENELSTKSFHWILRVRLVVVATKSGNRTFLKAGDVAVGYTLPD
jgi:hypothetical protein